MKYLLLLMLLVGCTQVITSPAIEICQTNCVNSNSKLRKIVVKERNVNCVCHNDAIFFNIPNN